MDTNTASTFLEDVRSGKAYCPSTHGGAGYTMGTTYDLVKRTSTCPICLAETPFPKSARQREIKVGRWPFREKKYVWDIYERVPNYDGTSKEEFIERVEERPF